jgi:hypothetical protein
VHRAGRASRENLAWKSFKKYQQKVLDISPEKPSVAGGSAICVLFFLWKTYETMNICVGIFLRNNT